MKELLAMLAMAVVVVLGRPQDPSLASAPAVGSANQPPVDIVSKTETLNPDGSFNYSYELSNGVKVQESGYIKAGAAGAQRSDDNGNDINSVSGSFSYTAPDGTHISLTYTADENGFQPQGDHLPTAPPVPEAIAKALSALPPSPEDDAQPTGAEQP